MREMWLWRVSESIYARVQDGSNRTNLLVRASSSQWLLRRVSLDDVAWVRAACREALELAPLLWPVTAHAAGPSRLSSSMAHAGRSAGACGDQS